MVGAGRREKARLPIVVMGSDPAPSTRPGTQILDREGGEMFEAIVVLVAVGILAVEVIEVRHKCN
jgi:hypothetical protein